MKLFRGTILAVLMCCAVPLAGCGDAPTAGGGEDVTVIGSPITTDTSVTTVRYSSRIQLIPTPGSPFPYIDTNVAFTDQSSPIGGYSYLVRLTAADPNVLSCTLFMNWATGSNFPQPMPNYVPHYFGPNSLYPSHWVTNSAYAQCKASGVYLPMPAGAVEYWDSTINPIIGEAAGYLVLRIPGYYAPMVSAVIRTN